MNFIQELLEDLIRERDSVIEFSNPSSDNPETMRTQITRVQTLNEIISLIQDGLSSLKKPQ